MSAGNTVRLDMSLRSDRMIKVAGRVLGEKGQPAPGVYVILGSRDLDVMFSAMHNVATTDAQGRFTIQGVVPGTYVLQAMQHAAGVELSAVQPMEVGNQPPSDVTLKLERGISISGRVLTVEDSAAQTIDLSSLHVWLSSVHGDKSGFGAAEVKKDGSFKMADLRRNKYSVHLTGLPQGWYLKSASVGSTDALERGVNLNSGAAATLELGLSSKAAQLSGTVLMENKPVAGARIQVTPEPANPFRRDLHRPVVTDQHGSFVLENMVPGRYKIEATLVPDTDLEENAGTATAVPPAILDKVELSENEKKTVSLKLEKPQ